MSQNCLGDNDEVKNMYRLYEIKLARLHSVACLRASAEEYAALKAELKTIYRRVMEKAGWPARLNYIISTKDK